MATPEEIASIKELLPADHEDYGWDDGKIAELVDSGLTGNATLLSYWRKVSADTSNLVDMSESGSSRSLSQVHKNAVAMAKIYQDLVDKENEDPDEDRKVGVRFGRIRRV